MVCKGYLGEEEEHNSEVELLKLRAKSANEKTIQEIQHGL